MDGCGDRLKDDVCLEVLKNAIEPFQLFGIFRKQVKGKAFGLPGLQILDQQIELPVK